MSVLSKGIRRLISLMSFHGARGALIGFFFGIFIVSPMIWFIDKSRSYEVIHYMRVFSSICASVGLLKGCYHGFMSEARKWKI